MRELVIAMLVGGASMMVTGCGKDADSGPASDPAKPQPEPVSECQAAFDKELECMEDEKRKAKLEGKRKVAIGMCEAASDEPQMKMMFKCSQKSTCAEFEVCKVQIQSAEDAKEITAAIASGDLSKAVSTCSYQLDAYQAGGDYKTACDSAFGAAAAKMDDEKLDRSFRYLCTNKDSAAWKKGSDTLKTICGGLGTSMQKVLETSRDAGKYEKYKCESYVEYVSKNAPADKAAAEKFCNDAKATADTKQLELLNRAILAQRDAGTKAEFSYCYKYKKLAEQLPAAEQAAAELLCEESKAAADFKKAMDEAQKALIAKKTRAPFQCAWFLKKGDDKLKGSKWFAAKAPILAKVCYGSLGKLILGAVSGRYCAIGAKAVHAQAGKFNLAASDPELQALLTKTKPLCVK